LWRRSDLLAVRSPLRGARTIRHPACLCYALANMDGKNKLYFGDNLKILRDYVEDASVDLIYLDPACARLPSGRAGRPPFNSSATYSFGVTPPFRAAHARLKPGATASGEESAAQQWVRRQGRSDATRRLFDRLIPGHHRSRFATIDWGGHVAKRNQSPGPQ